MNSINVAQLYFVDDTIYTVSNVTVFSQIIVFAVCWFTWYSTKAQSFSLRIINEFDFKSK